MDSHYIILKPVITEKSLAAQKKNCFSFWVNPRANKNQIKRAVEELFGVKPVSIRTSLLKGVNKRLLRKNRIIRTSTRKKAIVQLKEGEKISLIVQKKK